MESIGISNFNDQDANGNTFKLNEIDALTFICYLNKYGDEKRLQFLRAVCEKWNITPLPSDVNGIPNVNAQRVWLFGYKKDRNANEIQRLWIFFKSLLNNTINNTLFEDVLKIYSVGKAKITEVMFIVKPKGYLCLNGVVKPYLQQLKFSTDFSNFDDYLEKINIAKQQLNKSFAQISYEAYVKSISGYQKSEITTTVNEKESVYVAMKSNTAGFLPLNSILYGPPGTGKTYNTINKAVQIANPSFSIENRTREDIKKEYERLKVDGQIEFITFHQSMSYEDFIEGIKPKKPEEVDTYLKYEIQEGLFKKMAKRADYKPTPQAVVFSLSDDEFAKANFYKLSLGNTAIADDEQIYRYCIDNGYVALGWGSANDFTGKTEHEIQQMVPDKLEKFSAQAINYFIHYLKKGDYVVVSYGNLRFRAIGKVTGDYEYRSIGGLEVREVKQFRKVQWLLKDVDIPVEELYNKQFSQQTIYKLNKSEIKREFFVKGQVSKEDAVQKKNYVLIIDEINRGNISQIFGELITLIEPDKRKGANEALELMLPYSKEWFSVPANLHIVGTMNTADRSVEALDTALRRRFTFEPMMPKPELLNNYQRVKDFWVRYKHTYADDQEWIDAENAFSELHGMTFTDKEGYENLKPSADNLEEELAAVVADDFKPVVSFDGLDLEKLLHTVNERLSVLITKDHTIGHAWLMDVYSLDDLRNAFKHKILPLLQEYFYNNYAKIGLVLGNNFFADQKQMDKNIFASFSNANEISEDYNDKIVYTFKNANNLTLVDFKSIYEKQPKT